MPLYEILRLMPQGASASHLARQRLIFLAIYYTVRERVETGRYMLITGVGYTTENAWFSCNVPPLQILATETKDNAEKRNYSKKVPKMIILRTVIC